MIEQDRQKIIDIIDPESDIDIALDNKSKIDILVLSEIKESIEESTIPFTVDVVDLHDISQDLKKQILKDRVTWKK